MKPAIDALAAKDTGLEAEAKKELAREARQRLSALRLLVRAQAQPAAVVHAKAERPVDRPVEQVPRDVNRPERLPAQEGVDGRPVEPGRVGRDGVTRSGGNSVKSW